ncbi:MAG: glutaredoxin [Spirochaetales bacterium]|nr:glutaredoxin [Spirochaetales bacterium]
MINIQVIGTKKCKDTQKAERFLKDRSIPFHFADLKERGISVGELTKIASGRDPEDLVNTKSEVYKKKNFIYMDYNPLEEILENPELLITPIIRSGNKVIIGYDQNALKELISE